MATDLQLTTRAHDFASVLIAEVQLSSGEKALTHAQGVAQIADGLDGSEELQAACYLLYAVDSLSKPLEVLTKNFGESIAKLAVETRQLIDLQDRSRTAAGLAGGVQSQTENIRKMLLAFGRDLRVVLLRLASRLQTLRFYAANFSQTNTGDARQASLVLARQAIARETLDIFAPLANRLGLAQIKWELEDLSFRFLEPVTYKDIARLLSEKRAERMVKIEMLRAQLQAELLTQRIKATVEARPKHIYSIVKKMRGKNLPFERVFDVRAMRVLVDTVDDCYAALAYIHSRFTPILEEYDDYIAKPKSNGYQSLHTVVRDSADSKPIEIQIRTHAMHGHAEQGVAAHWAYKEAGAKGYSGVQASSDYDRKIVMLRALLDWEREVATTERSAHHAKLDTSVLQDRIYVLTPEAAIIDLPQGATPVDFAYQLHSNIGHRCRGATVDGAIVPLNTKLQSGQTVAITTAKEGGPSRDWLNPELGFLVSNRARAKVRAWFNAEVQGETIARGREAVEKLLQREGKTSIKLEELADQLGFKSADALFESVGKEEFSVKTIETHFKPVTDLLPPDEFLIYKKSKAKKHTTDKSGVLVEGVDSLMTQLAKCCKPAPPDVIGGFVTRGKGVSIHRADCSNFLQIAARSSDRVIDVSWSKAISDKAFQSVYPVDVSVQAADRNGLLRDISEVFSAAKINVIGVQTQSIKGNEGATAWMTFTAEVSDTSRLAPVMAMIRKVTGVRSCRRR